LCPVFILFLFQLIILLHGSWHDTAVCLSVMLRTVVESCTILLLAGHFLLMSSYTFAVHGGKRTRNLWFTSPNHFFFNFLIKTFF